jgi:hypothetical protein
MAEFNRKEDIKQCLELAKIFKDKAKRLKKEPSRQPSKKKKRTEADKRKRAEAFAKLKAGTYVPVAVAEQLAEADAVRREYQPHMPPVPVKTPEQIAYEANLAVSREIGLERRESGWDD